MASGKSLSFGPFRLDARGRLLRRGEAVVRLEPKAWDLLCHLVERAGQVVPKSELLARVWPDTSVTERSLTRTVGLLRTALDDDAERPRYIETIHRRGFRFVAEILEETSEPAESESRQDEAMFVGRSREIGKLDEHLQAAQRGIRQIVLIAGDAGIGKTSVVRTFLARARKATVDAPLWIASGQCVAQHGAGEAYMPVLTALGQLGRGAERVELTNVLRVHAPSWLVQLPNLVSTEESEQVRASLAGIGSGRMLREIAGALEVLASQRTIVLVLEDLHWSDRATLDFLAAVASSTAPAQLLIIGLYRPVDAILDNHPLLPVVQSLSQRRQCSILHLGALTENETAELLQRHLAGGGVAADVSEQIHARTTGNPLFLLAFVDHLVESDRLARVNDRWQLAANLGAIDDVPESVRQMIETQVEGLRPDEQTVLESASVAGEEFDLPAVSAAIDGGSIEATEALLHDLARKQRLVRRVGDRNWPDGTQAPRYELAHALYRDVLYERVPSAHRERLHQRIGERLEAGFAGHTEAIAAELAAHFRRSRDHARSVTYLLQAAAQLARRFVDRRVYLEPALHHLHQLPEGLLRDYQELMLRMNLGMSILINEGPAVAQLEECMAPAELLCDRLGNDPQITGAVFGVWTWHFFAAHGDRARARAADLLARCSIDDRPTARLMAHVAGALTNVLSGDQTSAGAHLDAIPIDELPALSEIRDETAFPLGFSAADLVVMWFAAATWNLWSRGYADQAEQRMRAGLDLAERAGNPFTFSTMQFAAAGLSALLGRTGALGSLAGSLIAFSADQGHTLWHTGGRTFAAMAELHLGSAEVALGKFLELAQDEAAFRINETLPRQMALWALTDVQRANGLLDAALDVIAAALNPPAPHLTRVMDADLHRQRGEIQLQLGCPAEAESSFREAIDIARRQGGRMFELRAAVSLCRLLRDQGKADEARARLEPLYASFTEGFDEVDLKEAAAVLAALSS